MEDERRILFRMSPELFERIKDYSNVSGLSQNDFLIKVVSEYLDMLNKPQGPKADLLFLPAEEKKLPVDFVRRVRSKMRQGYSAEVARRKILDEG